MMLPNLISASVMPGCWAETDVHAVSDSRTARANLLDWIMRHPPGGPPKIVASFERRLRQAQGTGLAFSRWVRLAGCSKRAVYGAIALQNNAG
jgi:hypothetical protein